MCGRFDTCKKVRLCDSCNSGGCKYCKHRNCNTFCKDFISLPECKITSRYPYVCNGCDKLRTCKNIKVFYKAHIAQEIYEDNVSSFKKGVKKTNKEIKDLDYHLSQGIRNGLSVSVIIAKNSLNISPSTAYKYINDKVLTVRNIDLKRKVRYKAKPTPADRRKRKLYNHLISRTLEDYMVYISEHPECNIWQMDTIMGKHSESECVCCLFFTLEAIFNYFLN